MLVTRISYQTPTQDTTRCYDAGSGDRMVMRLKLSVKGMELQSVGPWSWVLSGGHGVGDVTALWGRAERQEKFSSRTDDGNGLMVPCWGWHRQFKVARWAGRDGWHRTGPARQSRPAPEPRDGEKIVAGEELPTASSDGICTGRIRR